MIIVDILYANRSPRIYLEYAPSLRSERFGLLVLVIEDDNDSKMLALREN